MINAFEVYLRMQERTTELLFMGFIDAADASIAPILYRSALSMLDGIELVLEDGVYRNYNREYNERQNELALSLIADLTPNLLRHNSIYCLSFRECMHTVCGVSLTQFGRLLAFLDKPLKRAFPRSPNQLQPGELSHAPERRFKLFLGLFRLKQGVTFAVMETVFGWAKAAIQEWCQTIVDLLEANLYCFHEGFLDYKGEDWQGNECNKWRYKHIVDQSYDSYLQKINFQNDECVRNGGVNTINPEHFVGSIGAVDGTYCVQPRFGPQTLITGHEDPTLDPMWTGYKKCHAYKILLISSHGINEPKFLLWVESACGSASDSTVYGNMFHTLNPHLVPEAAVLGDHAFHGSKRVIAGYTTAQVNASIAEDRAGFNHNQSSDRMTSEHGVRSLKIWAVGRGRDDSFMFSNDAHFKSALRVVWGLHNYIASGCPVAL